MRVLFLDTENAPNYGTFYGIHDQKIRYSDIISEWFFICAQWAWMDDKKVSHISVLDDVKMFIKDHTNDKIIVEKIHNLISQADLIVGHNIKGHDLKKIKAKIVEHRLPPLDMPHVIDTYQWSKEFGFTSRKLGDLCKKLGLQDKLSHDPGIFQRAGQGDVLSIRKVIRYGKGDIMTLKELYLLLRPYAKNHPNMNAFKGFPCCPRCASVKMQKRGIRDGLQRFQCVPCRFNFSDKLDKKYKPTIRFK